MFRTHGNSIKGDGLVALAERNDINLLERWGHLNPGQRRMCLGNVLRHRQRRGGKVVL